jgi:hypothetical protein
VTDERTERWLLWLMKHIDPNASARYTSDSVLEHLYGRPNNEEQDVRTK